jgi:hypothetical protein
VSRHDTPTGAETGGHASEIIDVEDQRVSDLLPVIPIFLYLIALFAVFALVSVLLHREVKAERNRDRAGRPRDGGDGPPS